jgi:hypothetical protein
MPGTLEDREAIRAILALYTHALDRRRWELMARVFHPDATFGFGPVTGDWRAFVEQARSIIDPCTMTQHSLGQTLMGFADADTAHCETYLTATHAVPVGYPRPEVFPARSEPYLAIVAGRYVDRFEKRDGEWRIARRQGLYDWREYRDVGAADLLGMAEGSCGYHDERDPSSPVVAAWRG